MSDTNSIENLAESVELEHRQEFIRFANTSEASDEYMSHFDSCPNCQAAMQKWINGMANVIAPYMKP